jgi:hypothetical protein
VTCKRTCDVEAVSDGVSGDGQKEQAERAATGNGYLVQRCSVLTAATGEALVNGSQDK